MRAIAIATALVAVFLQVGHVQAFVSFGDVGFLHPDANGDGRTDAAVDLATDGAGNWVAATTAVQLISLATDACWGATFSDTSNNRYDLYKAKSD